MTTEHWNWLVEETETALRIMQVEECSEMTEDEIGIIISVLKSNIPFGI